MALLDIFDQINIAVERNDRVRLHEQFTRLMIIQDQLAREHVRQHEHTIERGTMREDGIDWSVWVCSCGCAEWGARW